MSEEAGDHVTMATVLVGLSVCDVRGFPKSLSSFSVTTRDASMLLLEDAGKFKLPLT